MPHVSRRRGVALLVLEGVILAGLAVAYWRTPGIWEQWLRAVTQPEYVVEISSTVSTVDERFLSTAFDFSHLLGGHWWGEGFGWNPTVGSSRVEPFTLDDPSLITLTTALRPQYIRVGGTESDKVWYAINSDIPDDRDFKLSLSPQRIDEMFAFATAVSAPLMFTINAGPGPRVDGEFDASNLEDLMAYMSASGHQVEFWEHGNEVNAYPITHGIHGLKLDNYLAELEQIHQLMDQYMPTAKLAAFASIIMPEVGEPHPLFTEPAEPIDRNLIDVVSWHYYPQQSRRCLVTNRPALSMTLLSNRVLGDVSKWMQLVNEWTQQHVPAAEVWLGETGPAQCGGEPGLSDRFISSLWWLHHLGTAAQHGQQVVVRQTLIGSTYGLIDDATLQPNPDYWASVLWKRLMGTTVKAVSVTPATEEMHLLERWFPTNFSPLRAFAHCHPEQGATVVLLNVDKVKTVRAQLPTTTGMDLYLLTANNPLEKEVYLNKHPLTLSGSQLPALQPVSYALPTIDVPPRSYAFAVLPDYACK